MIILGVVLIMLCWGLLKGITKIDISRIFREHFITLHRDNGSKVELYYFFVMPLLIAAPFGFNYYVNDQILEVVIMVFSIFVGLLFNLLLLLYDIVRKNKTHPNVSDKEIEEALIKQTYTNISFSISLSILIVAISFTFSICKIMGLARTIISIVLYYLIIVLLLTLLMVLKRIYILLAEEFNGNSQ